MIPAAAHGNRTHERQATVAKVVAEPRGPEAQRDIPGGGRSVGNKSRTARFDSAMILLDTDDFLCIEYAEVKRLSAMKKSTTACDRFFCLSFSARTQLPS